MSGGAATRPEYPGADGSDDVVVLKFNLSELSQKWGVWLSAILWGFGLICMIISWGTFEGVESDDRYEEKIKAVGVAALFALYGIGCFLAAIFLCLYYRVNYRD